MPETDPAGMNLAGVGHRDIAASAAGPALAAEGRKSTRCRAGAAAAANRLRECAVRAVAIGGDVAARRERNADPAARAARGARAA